MGHATFSRLVADEPRVLAAGKGRARRYAARRTIPRLETELPLFEVLETGETRRLAALHPIEVRGFYLDAANDDVQAGFHAGLPYFLSGMRPSGFLGRRLPQQHSGEGWPLDLSRWSDDNALQYLATYGWDTVGDLIIGEAAFQLFLERSIEPETIDLADRAARYPRLAEQALESGPPGSSAGGEQPKFLARVASELRSVLVKFSPPLGEQAGRRWSDLLCAEHVAHQILAKHGRQSASSELLQTGERTFLEVTRFDRLGRRGRRGVVSLFSLANELGGGESDWNAAARSLRRAGVIAADHLEEIAWRQLFGELIGNSDMHTANLSFFSRGARVTGLAPIYDMLPMLYRPIEGNIVSRELELRTPSPHQAAFFAKVCDAALDFWEEVSQHDWISPGFREIARKNAGKVERHRPFASLLPR